MANIKYSKSVQLSAVWVSGSAWGHRRLRLRLYLYNCAVVDLTINLNRPTPMYTPFTFIIYLKNICYLEEKRKIECAVRAERAGPEKDHFFFTVK